MDRELFGHIMAGLIIFGILGFFVVWGISFSRKFETIERGMDYSQVTSIVGYPDHSDTTEDITTCVWNVTIMRQWRLTKVIVFKDGKVFSITDAEG